jgi:hypothetical protein
MNSVSTWLFNFILWGALVTLAVLIYDKLNPGFLTGSVNVLAALIAVVAVAAVSALWPKY